MEQRTAKALRAAGLIATVIYAESLLVLPLIAFLLFARSQATRNLDTSFLGPMLLALSAVQYGVSLYLEAQSLAKARASRSPQGLFSSAIVTAVFGETFAIYALLLSRAPTYAWALFGLTFVHGVHLLLRWSNYTETARAIQLNASEETTDVGN